MREEFGRWCVERPDRRSWVVVVLPAPLIHLRDQPNPACSDWQYMENELDDLLIEHTNLDDGCFITPAEVSPSPLFF